MRRVACLGLLLALPGCVGTGEHLRNTFSLPGTNPNLPQADSLNLRRALGHSVDVEPLVPEPGNVWPEPGRNAPTLQDLQRDPSPASGDGFQPTEVPGRQPGLPAGRQPRPQGSSTPPGSAQPGLAPPPGANVLPQPRTPPGPGRNPTGSAVQLPGGRTGTDAGGTSGYRQLNTPSGPGAIMIPNGNGTSTVISPDGSVQTIPTPR